MKRLLVFVSLMALPLAAQNRRELMTKLVNDTAAARTNAKLDDAQKKQLDSALEGLQKATAAHKKGERPERTATKQSMKAITQLAQGEAFQPEDRKRCRTI